LSASLTGFKPGQGVDRVAALQRACSEHPVAYERYLAAIESAGKD
jgi:antirestriction protein